MTVRQYATPLAFKQALEQRLKSASTTGTDFGRRRQLLVFDRFLARLGRAAGDGVTLKGRLVLELRLERARTTKDVDLRMMGSSADVLELLQEAGRLDLGDRMGFEIKPDDEHPEIQNEGICYEGYRYRAECRVAGMIYGRPFDVVFGDPLAGEYGGTTAWDTHGFSANAPTAVHLVSLVSCVAGKFQALTMRRQLIVTWSRGRSRQAPELASCAGVALAGRCDIGLPMSTDKGAAFNVHRDESESQVQLSPLIERRRRTPGTSTPIQPATDARSQADLARRHDVLRPGMMANCSELNRSRAAAALCIPAPRFEPAASLGHQQVGGR